MLTFPTRRHRMLPLLCGILLLLRIGGVHLHLCFDGQELPVTLHLLDAEVEHFQGGTTHEHYDENIDDGSAAVDRNSTVDIDLPAILFAAFVLWVVLPGLRFPRHRRKLLPTFHATDWLRPPLRGPPATAFT